MSAKTDFELKAVRSGASQDKIALTFVGTNGEEARVSFPASSAGRVVQSLIAKIDEIEKVVNQSPDTVTAMRVDKIEGIYSQAGPCLRIVPDAMPAVHFLLSDKNLRNLLSVTAGLQKKSQDHPFQ